ncbi:hypothetical protein DKX38_008049 [Salix brachista]|uniref:Uncharacterized protein n=1 Tax=Salix brachista TaxID=2182728 RepID=A0A5N5MPP8_9ROSI|nr:hypothetical protein DKX38_008049 [Salix brachista]
MDLPEVWAVFGPGVAGAGFVTVGIFASIAALMFNCVRKEDIDYSPYEEGEWRLKLWLFFAYVVSFVSLAASVGLLIQDSIVKTGPSVWTGTAGVLQCVFVLISHKLLLLCICFLEVPERISWGFQVPGLTSLDGLVKVVL